MKAPFRISSVLLIALLVMQLTVPFFVIQSKRNAFLKEAKKRMKREMAIPFAMEDLVADKNFHWEKDGKEFFFNHGLYDVARIEIQHGTFMVYAVPDFAEKAFLSEMAKKDPTSDDGVFSAVPFHLFPPTEPVFPQFITSVPKKYFSYRFVSITHHQLPEDSPPENWI